MQSLLYVSRKKKSDKPMLTKFVNSVVIIDDNDSADKKSNVLENLQSVIRNQDIAVSYYSPAELKGTTFQKNKQLIFLDLCLNSSKDEKRNIQEEIRPLLKKILPPDFGNYGIIMWTKHSSYIDFLREKIQEDKMKNMYPSPLFIVGLDKMKYITANNFDSLFTDIEDVLRQNIAATFFLEWSNSVQKAQNSTVSNIYSLLPDYKTLSDDFTFLLKELAKNHTGIPESKVNDYPALYIDAYKSFDDILHAELINCQKSKVDFFSKPINPFSAQDKLTSIFAQLNTAMFIDVSNIVQNIVIPGNVYKVKAENDLLKIEGAPKKATKIVIEITPPCDFSQKKNGNPRIVSGFMLDWSEDKATQEKYLKAFSGDARYSICPLMSSEDSNPKFICFDFRYTTAVKQEDLQDGSKYEILFRAKPKLFADVLQKFSAHAARLGLSVIHS